MQPAGRDSNDPEVSIYFLIFSFSGCAAVLPTSSADLCLWDSQRVSTQVESHTRNFPSDLGIMVTPSSLLPSDLRRLEGSNLLGIFAAAKEQWIMSFSALGLEDLPWLALQHRPWQMNWSTSLPQ